MYMQIMMMIIGDSVAKAYKKVYTDDELLNRLQDNIEQTFKPLINSAIGDGQVIKSVYLAASTDTLVDHKLGREAIGYIVVKKDAAAVVFDKPNVNAAKNRFLTLNSTVNVTVDLWVF